MRGLRISETAEDDLRSIVRYIARESGRAVADAVYEQLITRCERIASLPGTLGTPRADLSPGLRSAAHKRYILYFRYTDDMLEIVNVLDARRDTFSHFTEQDPEI